MGYENVDEVARRQACERVKQIVKAIKAIKIKYYLNFSKISAKDKETYQKLESSLEKLSNAHDLGKLKVALMQEVSAKYDRKDDDMGEQEKKQPDDILQACYGAIDAQKEALSKGKITQARKCQEVLKKYVQNVDLENYRELITNYKREKFAELVKSRDELEQKNASWYRIMREFYKEGHTMERKNVVDIMPRVPEKEKAEVKNPLQDEIEQDEIEIV